MEEPSRSRSVVDLRTPTFQVKFIQKLSKIRTKFGRKDSGNANHASPYRRQTRSLSVDMRNKPYMSQPQFMTMPRSSQSTNGAEDSPISGTSSASPPTMRPGSSDVEREQRPRTVDIRETRRALFTSSPDLAVESRLPTSPAIMTSPDRASGASLPHSQSSLAADTQSQPQPRQTILLSPSTTMTITAATQTLSPPSSSGGGQGRRSPPPPQLMGLPAPPTRFKIEGGSARLSPSVISRHPPFPILNLPSISTSTPGPSQPQRMRPQSRLSSMPALPREGRDDSNQHADHENAMLAESDEEEMEGEEEHEEHQGSDDEEGDEPGDSATSRQSESSYQEGLPPVESSPFDPSFLNSRKDAGKQSTAGEMTPIARRAFDYFSSKPLVPDASSPTRTPKPGEAARHQPLLVPIATPGSPRPPFYQQASRSMIDLIPSRPPRTLGLDEQVQAKVKSTEPCPSFDGHASPKPPPLPKTFDAVAPALRRQRSMPMFSPSTDPPPYPTFSTRPKGPVIQPREDEGKEELPVYTNSIYLAAIMPRKMEFTAPGVQAKDRKWRRVFCVLEGTIFRVYKCPPGVAGVNPVAEWWEKKVGVGDVTNTTGTTYDGRIRIDSVRPREPVERPPKLSEEAHSENVVSPADRAQEEQRKKSKRFTVSLLYPSRHSHSTSSSVSPSRLGRSSLDSSRGDAGSSGRPSLTIALPPSRSSSSASSNQAGLSPQGTVTSSVSPTSSAMGGLGHFRISHSSRNSSDKDRGHELPVPDVRDLLRVYTLQHAESGLGSDYLKRRNVIRVRLEGEQFLLQASDVAAVVDWIEGFQAATNIALDLDERPMPKGPMFPRRRRRRVRRPEEAAQANAGDTQAGPRPP
ncbi:hypothetical protein NEOLEDRAFT_1095766 [Neolentinus lepideus HHB14362 ss-1]|uniref:PH domain-containing protein n=1 Tax=Neolentinus lepideus HHB14362 ss-1 TaxID=1314782 RepID=A0A165RDT9_9AGAM|nr:hypothetical protein NEOLEDRAFT_1095766 [Neolentinus lepideus HHB14362 ss-1]